jgi:hypothetical protein
LSKYGGFTFFSPHDVATWGPIFPQKNTTCTFHHPRLLLPTPDPSSISIFQQYFFQNKEINLIPSPLNLKKKAHAPFRPSKSKKSTKNFIKNILNNILKMKKNPHPLRQARIKKGNKSLTHNTKNNKKGKKKTHATLPP